MIKTAAMWRLLQEKGWKSVTKGHGIFEQIDGWVKEPFMRKYSTQEAYEKEQLCQAQE